MKWLKVLFSILGLLILVCVLAVACLIIFMDPNKLKPVIIAETMNKTGYQLAIEGSLSWSFYPRLSIKADKIMLSAANQPTPFIELSEVKVAADLMQLLRGKEKLQGDVNIAKLRLVNLHAEQVSANLHWVDHVLTLQPIQASLYGGTLKAIAMGSDLSSVPHWRWDVKFDHIDMQSLLQDINGPNSKIKISGIGQMKLQAQTQGNTQDQILNNISGTGEFNLNNGIVQGVDLNYFMQTADALINKEAVSQPENINQTAFNQLTGSFVIKQGTAETHDMRLFAPAFITKGEGTISLASNILELHLLIQAQQNAKTQFAIPVLLTGDLNRPYVRLDMTEIDKILAKQEIEKLKEKAVEQIQKHVPGKAGEFLQKLLGK